MAHVRKQLRDAVVTALTGLTTTGARVYVGRVYAFDQATELPALAIDTPDEQASRERATLTGLTRRQVGVEIRAKAKAVSGLPALLDTIAEEVETALGESITVAGVGVDLNYAGMVQTFTADSDQPVGEMTLRYTATLYSRPGAPGVFT